MISKPTIAHSALHPTGKIGEMNLSHLEHFQAADLISSPQIGYGFSPAVIANHPFDRQKLPTPHQPAIAGWVIWHPKT
jgi:hypothetical protein